MTERRIIRSLSELTSPQIQAILEKAEIKATGVCSHPPLDLDAIRARSEELDPKSQTKADIWLLLAEIERLSKAST